MSDLEKITNILISEFLKDSEAAPTDFDKFPILRRLLERTFESNVRKVFFGFFPSWSIFFAVFLPVAFFGHQFVEIGAAGDCFWKTPDVLRDLLRTPVNCSVCENLEKIDRLKGVEDLDEFFIRFVDAGVPVVITDATENWLARKSFSFEFFRSLYSNKSRANCQFFRYQSKFHSLQHVFETAVSEEGEPWYVGWSNCDGEIADILRSHYNRPYFLPPSSESAHTDWIFMGSPGYGAHLHVDDVDFPSWQTQIHGQKKWLLYPPPECHYSCPRKYLEVLLEPGDTLVVDTNWWYHKTLVVGDELSISIGSEFD